MWNYLTESFLFIALSPPQYFRGKHCIFSGHIFASIADIMNPSICYVRWLKMATGYVDCFSRRLISSLVKAFKSQRWAPLLVSWCTWLYTVEINLYWGAFKQDSISKWHVIKLCMVGLKCNFWVYFRLLGSCFFSKW